MTDEPADFVEIAIEDVGAHRKIEAKIEIVVGKVLVRLEKDAASTRIAEIVTALDRSEGLFGRRAGAGAGTSDPLPNQTPEKIGLQCGRLYAAPRTHHAPLIGRLLRRRVQ